MTALAGEPIPGLRGRNGHCDPITDEAGFGDDLRLGDGQRIVNRNSFCRALGGLLGQRRPRQAAPKTYGRPTNVRTATVRKEWPRLKTASLHTHRATPRRSECDVKAQGEA